MSQIKQFILKIVLIWVLSQTLALKVLRGHYGEHDGDVIDQHDSDVIDQVEDEAVGQRGDRDVRQHEVGNQADEEEDRTWLKSWAHLTKYSHEDYDPAVSGFYIPDEGYNYNYNEVNQPQCCEKSDEQPIKDENDEQDDYFVDEDDDEDDDGGGGYAKEGQDENFPGRDSNPRPDFELKFGEREPQTPKPKKIGSVKMFL